MVVPLRELGPQGLRDRYSLPWQTSSGSPAMGATIRIRGTVGKTGMMEV